MNDTAADAVPRWGLWAAAAVFAAWLVGAVVASSLALAIWGRQSADEPWTIVFTIAGQSIATVLALIAVSRLRGQHSLARDFGFRALTPDLSWLPVGAVLQLVGTLLILPLTRLADRSDAPQQLVTVISNAGAPARIALVVMVGVVVPVIEELMFRGVLLRALMRHLGAPLAVLIDALLFGVAHLLDPNAVLVLPVLIAFGLVAGWITARTGRLGPAIALHAGFNLVAVFFTFLT